MKTCSVLAVLFATGAVAHKGGKSTTSSNDVDSPRVACGTFTRHVDNATYSYYREGEELYVEAPTEFFTSLTNEWSDSQDLDAACTEDIFHKSVMINYNPQGHPVMDMMGGGFGVPHWDLHFFRPSIADMSAGGAYDTTSCVATGPVPVQCDQGSTDPRNVRFDTLPAEDEMTGFMLDTMWGGHAIIGHANHLLDTNTYAPGGAGTITLNNNGIVSPVGPPPFAICLMQGDGVDRGCRLPFWDGLDSVLLSFNGEVIGQEPMFSNSLLSALSAAVPPASTLSTRAQKAFPRATTYKYTTKYATAVFIAAMNGIDGSASVQIGIVVGDVSGDTQEQRGGKGKKESLSMTAASSGTVHAVGVSGGIALLVVGVALVMFRSRRQLNTVVGLQQDESETTPLTV